MSKSTGGESVDELRHRLNSMKKMMAERRGVDLDEGRRSTNLGVIDGSFLSVVFGLTLFVILTVSVYAFYNLYSAIIKNSHIPTKNCNVVGSIRASL
ncbi:hypothetical protein NQ318_006885 [Aromia moschata]|uniref:Uncharacterized protein n=1 Tax=Aromia moschata TaxID=1265417 RepID=A0AAV8YI06_9CUCU|nr:hypothetical protein NQ318_006885 [Aromia moschata]